MSVDGERVGLFPIGPERRQSEYEDDRDAAPQLRIPVRAGPRTIAVTFVKKTSAANEALVRPYRRSRGGLPSVAAVTISGPEGPSGAADTPTRRRLFVCRPTTASTEEGCARRILLTLTRRAYRRAVANDGCRRATPFLPRRPRRRRIRHGNPARARAGAGQSRIPAAR